jgi:uncharacterized protein DUF1800
MGKPPYYALPPTGYYITADRWMNSSALVDRLNFAYALTSNKFANQKFDSEHVLALGLMGQSSIVATATASQSKQPVYKETALTQNSVASSPTMTGQNLALHLIESSLIGEEVSAQTNNLIHQQAAKLVTASSPPGETLNLLTALVLGSPEFQMR